MFFLPIQLYWLVKFKFKHEQFFRKLQTAINKLLIFLPAIVHVRQNAESLKRPASEKFYQLEVQQLYYYFLQNLRAWIHIRLQRLLFWWGTKYSIPVAE